MLNCWDVLHAPPAELAAEINTLRMRQGFHVADMRRLAEENKVLQAEVDRLNEKTEGLHHDEWQDTDSPQAEKTFGVRSIAAMAKSKAIDASALVVTNMLKSETERMKRELAA